jgi:hypothetical protein
MLMGPSKNAPLGGAKKMDVPLGTQFFDRPLIAVVRFPHS